MEINLTASIREKNEKLAPEFIPAVIYGKEAETKSLKMRRADFDKAFAAAGESNLISLEIDGQVSKVLVKETQHDVMKNIFTHADFYQVNMKEKITTEIPLHFVGESKAVRELGGTLIKDMSELEVECLPTDLVDHIDVDISVLNTFDDMIRVEDLVLPKGIALVHHTNDAVAAVREPKVEAPAETVPAEAAPAAGKAEDKSEDAKKAEKK